MPNVAALATNQMQNLMTPPNPGASEYLRRTRHYVFYCKQWLFCGWLFSTQITAAASWRASSSYKPRCERCQRFEAEWLVARGIRSWHAWLGCQVWTSGIRSRRWPATLSKRCSLESAQLVTEGRFYCFFWSAVLGRKPDPSNLVKISKSYFVQRLYFIQKLCRLKPIKTQHDNDSILRDK